MNNPEKLATQRDNQEWTIQRNWQHKGTIKNEQSRETGNTKGQSRMERNWQHKGTIKNEQSRETGTQDTRMDNPEGNKRDKTKRNWQHTTQYMLETSTHKTQNEDKQNKNTTQYVLDTTIHKQT